MASIHHQKIRWLSAPEVSSERMGEIASFPSHEEVMATRIGLSGDTEAGAGHLVFEGEESVIVRMLFRVDLPVGSGSPDDRIGWSAVTIERGDGGLSDFDTAEQKDKGAAFLSTFPYHLFDRFDSGPFRSGIQRSAKKREKMARRHLKGSSVDPEDRELLRALLAAATRRAGRDWTRTSSGDRVAMLGAPRRPAGTPLTPLTRPRRLPKTWNAIHGSRAGEQREVIGVGPSLERCLEALDREPRLAELVQATIDGSLFQHPSIAPWAQVFRPEPQCSDLAREAKRLMKGAKLFALAGPMEGLSADGGDASTGFLFRPGARVSGLVEEIYLKLAHHVNRQLSSGEGGGESVKDAGDEALPSVVLRMLQESASVKAEGLTRSAIERELPVIVEALNLGDTDAWHAARSLLFGDLPVA